jgi:phenylacetic acid degradation operon negative regulatory protein
MTGLPLEPDELGTPASGRMRAGRGRSVLRGPSARAYLLMLLGQFALDQGDRFWTRTVVRALGLVGFEENAARQALSRSQAAGWLAAERHGRLVRWHITPAGRTLLVGGRARLFAPGPERDWDGDWLVLLTTVSERHRDLRHQLRSALGWVGFGALAPGVWISPHPSHAEEARQVLRSLGSPVQGTLLHARLDDPGERQKLVAQAWDVGELATRYKGFIERFAGVEPDAPAEAVAERTHLLYEWRRLVLVDPGLPPALLPPEWSGEHARRLLLSRSASWEPPAQAWWRACEAESETGSN